MDTSNLVAGSPLHPPICRIQLFTDSSMEGWGAHIGDSQVSGMWSLLERESDDSIKRQAQLEQASDQSFEDFVKDYFNESSGSN